MWLIEHVTAESTPKIRTEFDAYKEEFEALGTNIANADLILDAARAEHPSDGSKSIGVLL